MSKKFLGRGWSFPVDVGADGKVAYSAEEQKIRESVLVILGTARGERVMRPDFGSRLHELAFATVNASTKSLASLYVTEALVRWEPRIDVLRVAVRAGHDGAGAPARGAAGVLAIEVEYRVRSTNSVFNLVYPFYLNAGRA